MDLARWLALFAALLVSAYPARFLAGSTLWTTLDGRAHSYRVLLLETTVSRGDWYPHWVPDLLHGYGYPLFEFYAPLTYYLALPLRALGLPHLRSLDCLVAFSFLVGALGTYLLVGQRLGPLGSFLGAAAYTCWPYRLATVYVRGDVPEALALGLFPVALWSLVRLERSRTRPALALAALAFAAIVCAHNVTAALVAPVAAAVARVPLLRRDYRLVAWRSAALALALGMSAFFWAPAVAGTLWLRGGRLLFADYLANLGSPLALIQPISWAYHYYPDTGNSELTIPPGFVALLTTLPGLALLLRKPLPRRGRAELLFALALVVVPLVGMLRPLAPVLGWLQIIQAPYRLLGIAGLGAAFLVAASAVWLRRLPVLPRLALGLTLALVLVVSATARLAPARSGASAKLGLPDLYAYESVERVPGTTWVGEFTPRWASADPFAFLDGADAPEPGRSAALAGAEVEVRSWSDTDRTLAVSSSEGVDLAIHTTYLPGWRAEVDSRPATIEPLGPRGLVHLKVPPGEHVVRISLGTTASRALGSGLSALAALVLLVGPRLVFPPRPKGALPVGWVLAYRPWHECQRYGRGPKPRPDGDSSPPSHHTSAIHGGDGIPDELVKVHRGWDYTKTTIQAPSVRGLSLGCFRLALAAGAVALALLLAGQTNWLTARPDPAPQAVRVSLGGSVELAAVGGAGATVAPGETPSLDLYWLALAPSPTDYKAFVHLVGPDGRTLAQHDGRPVYGSARTSTWWKGELVQDRHLLAIPADAPPGEYRLVVGLYDEQTGARPAAQALAPATIQDGNSVVVGTLRVGTRTEHR